DEADELVEGVAGEARGAAGLGAEDGRLGVGGGGGGEDQPGDDEGDRGQPEGERGGDAEGVVDRRADVSVGGGEQRPDAVDATQRFVSWDSLGHLKAAGTGHFCFRIYARPLRAPQVLAAELGGGGDADQLEGELELGDQGAQDPLGARLTVRGEAPGGRPADEDGVGAERQGDGDVDAATDAAVDQHRDAPGDRLDDLRQRFGGGHGPVELAAAVVGDDDPGDAVLDREGGVLGGEHALDEERHAGVGG